MLYLALPDPRGNYQDAGAARFALAKLPDRAKVSGPRQPITADSEAAAAQQAGLTLRAEALSELSERKYAEIGGKLRADLLAVFAGWTPGEQYDFEGARQALNADLLKGDRARALQGVTTFRAGDSSLAPHRQQVLDVLNAAVTRYRAVTAATTPEEIAVA